MCPIWSLETEEMGNVRHTQTYGRSVSFSSFLMSTQTASPASAELVFYLDTPVLLKSILHPRCPVNVVAAVGAWSLPGDGQTMAFHLKVVPSLSALPYPRSVGDQSGGPGSE